MCTNNLSSSARTSSALCAATLDVSHKIQSQKCASTATRLVGVGCHGGSWSCGSEKMKSSLAGPRTISIQHCVSLSRSHCCASGASGSHSDGIAGATAAKSSVSTLKSQSEYSLARPSAREPTSRTDCTAEWCSTAAIARSSSVIAALHHVLHVGGRCDEAELGVEAVRVTGVERDPP